MSNFSCPSDLCPISALSNRKMSKTAMSKSMSNFFGILAFSGRTDEFGKFVRRSSVRQKFEARKNGKIISLFVVPPSSVNIENSK